MNKTPIPGMPYGNSAVLDSTASVTFNPAISETDIPLTAAPKPGQSQYNGQTYGQPGYSVYAPQPRRPQQPPPPSGGYPMSEHKNGAALPPGAGYPYSASQPSAQGANPFSDSARVPYQPSAVSYQRQAPPRGYGSPPPGTFTSSTPRRGPLHPGLQTSAPQPPSSQLQRLASPPPPASRPPTTSAPQTPT